MGKSTVKLVAIIIALALIITSFSFVVFMPMAYGATEQFTIDEQVKLKDADLTEEERNQLLINRLNLLYQYINLLDQNYKDEIDINTIVDGAYKGATDALGDIFSEYYDVQENADAFTEYVNNTFVGIGVRITTVDGGTVIEDLLSGSPAEKVGLQPGDRFVTIDGQDVSSWDNAAVSKVLRGEENTTVKVTVLRNGKNYDYTIPRAKVSDSSLTGTMTVYDGIGYILISKFDQDTATEFKQVYEGLQSRGAKGFVIDLRDNGGGYTEQAEKIADYILEGCLITQYEEQGKVNLKVRAKDGHKVSEPLVILVNKGTASSAELLAGTLQQAGYKLVGTNTYGKGFSQIMKTLVDGHSFKLSTNYFLVGDKGVKITTSGLTPDYYVAGGTLTEEQLAEAAEQIEKFAPLTLTDKPTAGSSSLTVYAAQQRLGFLGYDTAYSGVLDGKTITALKQFQSDCGLYAYAVIDISTQKMLDAAVMAFGSGTDAANDQAEKAIEILGELMK